MGNTVSTIHSINFEDMQFAINEKNSQKKMLIINTLDAHQQSCLIAGTLNIDSEVEVLNDYFKNDREIMIIIYGMNSTDDKSVKKYDQLMKLGFYNVYIYSGGLFEWLLLQDIYGNELFPTTATNVDFLKYKGRQQLNVKLLSNY